MCYGKYVRQYHVEGKVEPGMLCKNKNSLVLKQVRVINYQQNRQLTAVTNTLIRTQMNTDDMGVEEWTDHVLFSD